MRILLTANASYVPPRGGATRSNLFWLESLSAAGHECRVVAAALAHDAPGRLEQMRDEQIHIGATGAPGEVEQAQHGRIAVWSVGDPGRQVAVLREQIREFRPDWVLVSSEDLGHLLLREAHHAAPGRVVYLAHTPQFFPFGPASWNPEADGAALVRNAAAVVAIGRETAAYIQRHAGCDAAIVHPPIYGTGPFPKLGRFGNGLITMINPCAVKGISIFLALAEQLPERGFGALPGWGTTAHDRRNLEQLANVTILPNSKNIEDVLARTQVLLMPSLWLEGFGLIVVEAMLRGIPVVASDSGGLGEAKMGTRFVLHVAGIERYESVFDERAMPKPILPALDIKPWKAALGELLSDRAVYERESEASRQAALAFVGGLRPGRLEELLQSLSAKHAAGEAKPRRAGNMRILLAQNSLYYPAHGGGDKSNRLLVEALAAHGHVCRVVARTGGFGPEEHRRFLGELAARSVPVISSDSGVVIFRHNGVEVHVVTSNPNLRAYFAGQIAAFAPSVILASTDDPAQLLLEAALRASDARVVYLARATLALPFGPDCAFPSAAKTESLRQADGVVGVSQYVADYIRRWSGIEAVSLPISLLDPGPWPVLGRFDNEFVTLVNPCAVKGITIFLALAEAMPEVQFAAVPTWGTNQQDRAALLRHPNVRVLDPVDNVDEILARTRVLLAPSLWAEARSRIVVEAMLRGVPVVASDIGGIPEAKMGVDYLLPVRPIVHYRPQLDEQMVPVADVPEQDIGPWREALARLLTDRAHYEDLSKASHEAALSYASKIGAGPFEGFLNGLAASPKSASKAAPTPSAVPQPHAPLDSLSPEKRRLVALRLRKKSAAANWFPNAAHAESGQLRLFCFPHAGGGIAAFHGWAKGLPAGVFPCPAWLPGRESRLGEAPFRHMTPLVEALAEAIHPYVSKPFAFFGHSMGAAVAFELARSLRRRSCPLPAALFVSGARAPQFRLGHIPRPEPTESEFIEELRRMEGVPEEILVHEGLMRVLLPALQADSALYRNYIYLEEPPFAFPIRAYGGCDDSNVTPAHLEAWGRQTTSTFACRMFPGGHFFVQTAQAAFLEALSRDLGEL
jgi:surfactin synthase thioesterase subunit/glycosyltransferase involved in cell wall biosynthesis